MCLDESVCNYLATDHDGTSNKWHVRVLLESVVQRDDVKDVQQLTLVLVNAFHLHVEQRRRIHGHLVLLLNVRSQLHLILLYKTVQTFAINDKELLDRTARHQCR